MIVEILGSDLPGRGCGPAPDGSFYDNIHVGLARQTETVDLVPGDAASARWAFEVTVRELDDGIDITGPFVHGKRGERAFGLDGAFRVTTARSPCSEVRSCASPTSTLRPFGRR